MNGTMVYFTKDDGTRIDVDPSFRLKRYVDAVVVAEPGDESAATLLLNVLADPVELAVAVMSKPEVASTTLDYHGWCIVHGSCKRNIRS